MRIPLEHFNNTPVFALSPTGSNGIAEEGEEVESEQQHQPQSLLTNPVKEKKLSLPSSLGLLSNKSVGSAPNSPTLSKKSSVQDAVHPPVVNSISADVGGPVSLPPPPPSMPNKYATLPIK